MSDTLRDTGLGLTALLRFRTTKLTEEIGRRLFTEALPGIPPAGARPDYLPGSIDVRARRWPERAWDTADYFEMPGVRRGVMNFQLIFPDGPNGTYIPGIRRDPEHDFVAVTLRSYYVTPKSPPTYLPFARARFREVANVLEPTWGCTGLFDEIASIDPRKRVHWQHFLPRADRSVAAELAEIGAEVEELAWGFIATLGPSPFEPNASLQQAAREVLLARKEA